MEGDEPTEMDIPDDSEISINFTPDILRAALKVIEDKAQDLEEKK